MTIRKFQIFGEGTFDDDIISEEQLVKELGLVTNNESVKLESYEVFPFVDDDEDNEEEIE